MLGDGSDEEGRDGARRRGPHRARDLRIDTDAEFFVLRSHALIRTRSSGLGRTAQLCKCGVPTEAEADTGHLHSLCTESPTRRLGIDAAGADARRNPTSRHPRPAPRVSRHPISLPFVYQERVA